MQSNQYIDKALLIEGDMLTVPEFIKATEYSIDAFMIDRFWHTMKKGMLIYIDADLITWMGYSNAEEAQRKQAFLRLLSLTKLNLGSDYFQYSNDEYSRFLTALVYTNVYTKIYPEVDISHGKGTTKHLLLTPKCLKTTMMKLSTACGDQVREYYIALEELFETYIGYQSDYKSRQIIRELETKNNAIVLFQQQLAAKDKQLLIAENKNLAIQNYIANVKMLEAMKIRYIEQLKVYASLSSEVKSNYRYIPHPCSDADQKINKDCVTNKSWLIGFHRPDLNEIYDYTDIKYNVYTRRCYLR